MSNHGPLIIHSRCAFLKYLRVILGIEGQGSSCHICIEHDFWILLKSTGTAGFHGFWKRAHPHVSVNFRPYVLCKKTIIAPWFYRLFLVVSSINCAVCNLKCTVARSTAMYIEYEMDACSRGSTTNIAGIRHFFRSDSHHNPLQVAETILGDKTHEIRKERFVAGVTSWNCTKIFLRRLRLEIRVGRLELAACRWRTSEEAWSSHTTRGVKSHSGLGTKYSTWLAPLTSRIYRQSV